MGRGVVLDLAAVVTAGDHRAVSDDDGSDGNVVMRRGRARLGQGFVHQRQVVAGSRKRSRVERGLHQTPR